MTGRGHSSAHGHLLGSPPANPRFWPHPYNPVHSESKDPPLLPTPSPPRLRFPGAITRPGPERRGPRLSPSRPFRPPPGRLVIASLHLQPRGPALDPAGPPPPGSASSHRVADPVGDSTLSGNAGSCLQFYTPRGLRGPREPAPSPGLRPPGSTRRPAATRPSAAARPPVPLATPARLSAR